MKYDSCIIRSLFDPCCFTEEFVNGCGGPYFNWSNWFDRTTENKLLYFNKNGEKGGEPIAADCEDLLTNLSDVKLIEKNVSVFPNPFTHELTIKSEEVDNLIKEIKLMDISGNTLRNTKVMDTQFSIKTHQLSVGIYVLEISLESGKVLRKKVVKN